MASGDPDDDTGQGSVSLLRQSHTGQGIVSMRIESRRDQHKVRLERISGRHEEPLEDLPIILIALPGRHGNINRQALALPFSPFGGSASPGIVGILVRAEEEYRWVVIKGMLGPIPVMDVPVHNQHAGDAMTSLEVARSDRHTI